MGDDEWAFPSVRDPGLCWAKPAISDNPHVGVERVLILEQDVPYRFFLVYNAPEIEGHFFKGTIRATLKDDNAAGASFDDPIVIGLYLDEVVNYRRSTLESRLFVS